MLVYPPYMGIPPYPALANYNPYAQLSQLISASKRDDTDTDKRPAAPDLLMEESDFNRAMEQIA